MWSQKTLVDSVGRADWSHDGKHTLVECDKHILKRSRYDDLYKLDLAGYEKAKAAGQ
jgi:hypothetical protein